jgi:peroxiredoxin
VNLNTIKYLIKLNCVVAIFFYSQLVTAAVETPSVINESKITLQDFSDGSVLFENYIKAKQWTVVMFWASDCHVCNVEANQFVNLHKKYKDKNIRVLGVSVDGKRKKRAAQEFINIHNINFPNLIGELEIITQLYNQYTGETWVGTPTFIIFSPEGKVMAQRPGMLPTELIVGFIENQTNK